VEAPPLRPLGVGDIVDRVFAVYRSKPLLFLAVAAVPYLLFLLIVAGAGLLFVTNVAGLTDLVNSLALGAAPDPAILASAVVSLLEFVGVIILIAVVVLSTQTAALVSAMTASYLGRPITLAEAFRAGLRAAPRVIATGLLVFLIISVIWVLLILVMALSQQAAVAFVAVLVGLIGTAYFFASTLVAPVVATVEKVGPLTAIRRSWSLSGGNRWRIIGLQLLLLVLNVVISTVVSAVFFTSVIADANIRTAVQQITNAVVTIAWAPVEWGTLAVLYFDLRVRHEAFDLTLAAEALPRDS
jgi:hypothetical protein